MAAISLLECLSGSVSHYTSEVSTQHVLSGSRKRKWEGLDHETNVRLHVFSVYFRITTPFSLVY